MKRAVIKVTTPKELKSLQNQELYQAIGVIKRIVASSVKGFTQQQRPNVKRGQLTRAKILPKRVIL